MKKILLCSFALLSLSVAAKAQGVFKVTKKDGAATGFDHISQKTDQDGNTVMTFTGAGNDRSGYIAPPDPSLTVDYNRVITFVDEQIKQGKQSGKAVVEGQQTEWKGTDVYNYTLTATAVQKSGN